MTAPSLIPLLRENCLHIHKKCDSESAE